VGEHDQCCHPAVEDKTYYIVHNVTKRSYTPASSASLALSLSISPTNAMFAISTCRVVEMSSAHRFSREASSEPTRSCRES
jgi:hypothetical protein